MELLHQVEVLRGSREIKQRKEGEETGSEAVSEKGSATRKKSQHLLEIRNTSKNGQAKKSSSALARPGGRGTHEYRNVQTSLLSFQPL